MAARRSFLDNITKTETCWLWNGSRDGHGYGQVRVNGAKRMATHVSLGLHRGILVPKGKLVCHKCDNPRCVNPEHLFVGTYKNNYDDMVSKGRRKTPSTINPRTGKIEHITGEKNSQSKLTELAVIDIRKRAVRGNQRLLASEYGVHHSLVQQVVKRRIWNHI